MKGLALRPHMITLRIREWLAAKDWTAYRLAKEAKISLTLAYRLAKSKGRFRRIDHDTLEKLCVAFHCQPGDLFAWDGKHSPRRSRWR